MFFRCAGAFAKSRAYCIIYRVDGRLRRETVGRQDRSREVRCEAEKRIERARRGVAERVPVFGCRAWGLGGGIERLYVKLGRPSIPPERLLRALPLPAVSSVCSEPQLIEELDYNLLLRWFVALPLDETLRGQPTAPLSVLEIRSISPARAGNRHGMPLR